MPYEENDEKEQLPIDTVDGLVADIMGKKSMYKESRKKWEPIWKDQEERWHLITHGKTEEWMSDNPTTESNISVEGALPEIEDALFGGPTGQYFGEQKFGTYAPLPVIHELMRLRLDKQIKLRKLFGGHYGLRDLLIKGTMIGMVSWKQEGGNTLKYIQAIDPVTLEPDYYAEKAYKKDLIDRPDVRLLPLESVFIEPVENFTDATKIHVECVPTSEVKRKYPNYKKLESHPFPSKEDSKDTRPGVFKDEEAEKRKPNRDMVELTHCWGWWSKKLMEKVKQALEKGEKVEVTEELEGTDDKAFTMEMHNQKQQELGEAYSKQSDEQEVVEEPVVEDGEEQEAYFHIVIGNRGCLLEIDESPYFIQPDPFFIVAYIPISGEHYGLGIPYIIKGPQDRIKDVLDLQLDNIKLRLYSMLKYKPNSTIDKLVLKIKPMGVIPDRSGNDVSFLEVPDATGQALATINDARLQVQEGSGVNKIITGSGEGLPNKTATGASLLHEQSSKKFRLGVRWIGNNTIVPILDKIYALDRQFTPPKKVGELLGDEYKRDWAQVKPEELYPEAEFMFVHSSDLVSAEYKVRALNDMNLQYRERTWWNELEVAREQLKTMGIDQAKYIIPPEVLKKAGVNTPMLPNTPMAPNASASGRAPEEFTQPSLNGTDKLPGGGA